MRAKIAKADNMMSILKLKLEVKEKTLLIATSMLTEHQQNLTAAAIRANQTETVIAEMRAKITQAEMKLSVLKSKL